MKRILGGARLGFLPGPILVIGILLQMQKSEPFGFFDVRLTLFLGQHFPPAAETLGDLRVVHVRRHLDDLPTFDLGPDHEGVHRPLDVIGRFLALSGVGVRGRRCGVDLERTKLTQNRRRVGGCYADGTFRGGRCGGRAVERLQVDGESSHCLFIGLFFFLSKFA